MSKSPWIIPITQVYKILGSKVVLRVIPFLRSDVSVDFKDASHFNPCRQPKFLHNDQILRNPEFLS